jgi:isoprenylcysteine carboxyl methyltransferase (ICMT) family protein YpbQ
MKSPLNRGGLRFCLVLIALLRGAGTHATILAGIPLVVLGTLIHFWAKGCLRQNVVVAKSGPYRFVRHPFYLANALIDAAIAVMSGWWVLQVALPFWWLAIYIPVMRKEESYLGGAFGSIYDEYKRRVPRLIPWRRPLRSTSPGFSWNNPNIAEGEEISRALRLMAYPLLFLVCLEFRASGLSFLGDNLNVWALATLGTLYGLAWEFKRHLRQKRLILPQAADHWGLAPGVALLAGVSVLCELWWLAAVAALLCAAGILDARLRRQEERAEACLPLPDSSTRLGKSREAMPYSSRSA